MILTIKRSKWLTGSKQSMLLNDKGKMCCLGMLAKTLNAEDEDINGAPSPIDAQDVNWPESLLKKFRTFSYTEETEICRLLIEANDTEETEICHLLIEANDNKKKKRYEREEILRGLFKSIGINVRFID